MPRDAEGNITTNPSVNVKTIHDVMRDEKLDVIPLFKGGMARVNEDKGDGKGVVLTSQNSPAAPGGGGSV